jgi:hypothetical protein
MSSIFVDNSTGDACYFKQTGTYVFWHCIPSCITPGSLVAVAPGPGYGGAFAPADFTCKDSHMSITQYQAYCPSIYTTTPTVLVTLGQMTSNSMSNFNLIHSNIGTIWGYDGLTSTRLYTASSADSPYTRWNFGKSLTSISSNLYYQVGGNSGGIDCLSSVHLVPPITTGVPASYTDNYACCDPANGNADCEASIGVGACCSASSKTCYDCGISGGKREANLYLASSDPHYGTANFCPAYTSTFAITARDAETNQVISSILPATISATVSGGGSIYPSSCITLFGSPCLFTYTTRPTAGDENIVLTYSGTSQYNAIQGTFTFAITNTCHFLRVKVYDATAAQKALGNLNPLDPNSILALTNIWLKNVNVNSALGTCYTGTDGVCNLQAINTSLAVTFSKSGYVTLNHTFTTADLDKTILVALYQTGAGQTTPSLPDNSLPIDLPTEVSDVTTGLLSIAFAFFAIPFVWVMLIITVIFGLIIVRWLLVGTS